LDDAVLTVTNLTVNYGLISAVKGINFHAYNNEIVGIVGPNGAGKTTLLEAFAGTKEIKDGEIIFLGHRIERWPVLKRRKLGLMLLPQEDNVFPIMTVKENLEVGVIMSNKEEREGIIDYVYEIFPVLYEKRRQIARSLSGGQRRMLAVGIGLASNAKAIMIDEPSIGLAPKLVTKLLDTLVKIKEDTKRTIILSEQNIKILNVADRLFGLEAGEIKFSGKTKNLSKDIVKDLYMGG
jgi:branched-chain amino acid transport system ATP-binding protein